MRLPLTEFRAPFRYSQPPPRVCVAAGRQWRRRRQRTAAAAAAEAEAQFAAHQLRPAAALGQVAAEYARVCAALQEHCAGLVPWCVARQRCLEGEDPLAAPATAYGARGASGRTAAGLLEANKARRKWQRTQPPLLLEALSDLAGGGYVSVGSWLSSLPNGRRRVVLRVAPPAVRAGLAGFVWLRRLRSAGACACVVAGTPPPAPSLRLRPALALTPAAPGQLAEVAGHPGQPVAGAT